MIVSSILAASDNGPCQSKAREDQHFGAWMKAPTRNRRIGRGSKKQVEHSIPNHENGGNRFSMLTHSYDNKESISILASVLSWVRRSKKSIPSQCHLKRENMLSNPAPRKLCQPNPSQLPNPLKLFLTPLLTKKKMSYLNIRPDQTHNYLHH